MRESRGQAEGFEYLTFRSGTADEKYLWVVNDQDGGLYRISRKNYDVEFIRKVIDQPKVGRTEYSYATYYQNKVHFFPIHSTGSILIYDIKNDRLRTIKFHTKDLYLFLSIKIKQEVWLFPNVTGKPLIKYHILEERIEYLHFWSKVSAKYNLITNSAVAVDGKVWLSTYNSSKIAEVDLEELIVKLHYIGDYKLGNIAFDGELFWFSLMNESKILSWDKQHNTTKQYGKDLIKKEFFTGFTYTIVCLKGKVILLPLYDNKIYWVNRKNDAIEFISNMPQDFKIFKNYYFIIHFLGYEIVDNQLWIFPICGSHLLVLNLEDMRFDYCRLKKTTLELVYRQYTFKDAILKESTECNKCLLRGYLRVLSKVNKNDLKTGISNYGSDIFRYIKSDL